MIYLVAQMRVSQNEGYHFGSPKKKDYGIFGSMLGSPYVGKLPGLARQGCRVYLRRHLPLGLWGCVIRTSLIIDGILKFRLPMLVDERL